MSWKKWSSLFLGISAAGLILLCPLSAKAEEAQDAQTQETEAQEETSQGAVIPDHITISGQDVSGMTEEEANQVVADYLAQYGDTEFTLVAGEKSLVADGEDIALTAKNSDVVQRALNYGKEGNLISRYKANKDVEAGVEKDFAISLTADINTVKTFLDENSDELNVQAVNNGLTRVDGSFQYVPGSSGVIVLTDRSAVVIADYISAEWNGENASIELITEVTEPKGTEEELAQVQDLLGSYSTDFSSSASGRKKNITTGTNKLNGTILYPGETLSVHDVVAPFTEENGYALAGAYENGTTIDSYGGGICQVSTTLYNAVMRAELEIVTRAAHSMIVSYVEPSFDAAIAGEVKDLQFKNNQETPIYIEGYTSGGKVYFNIYGKETRPSNRTVTDQNEITSQTDPITEYVIAEDLPVGTIKQTQSSHTGYTARLWKIVTVDGQEESRRVYNNSTYKVSNRIVSVGIASASAEAAAAIRNAVATQDEATIRSTVNQWMNAGTQQPAAASQPTADPATQTPDAAQPTQ